MKGQTTLTRLLMLASVTLGVTSMYPSNDDVCNKCCQGPPGVPGVHGNHGMPGVTGPEGIKGPGGDRGNKGERGTIGLKGEMGDKGARGKRGNKGACAAGRPGDEGPKGPMGPMGPKGDKGYKGERCTPTPRVSFFVTRTSWFGPVNQDTNIEFDKVFLNEGSGFNPQTSQFVCTVNGTYLFNVHILSQEDKDAFVMIMLNNQPQIPLHGDHRSGFGVASNTAIFHLLLGDTVWLRLKKNSAISNDSSTFSGFLIYAD